MKLFFYSFSVLFLLLMTSFSLLADDQVRSDELQKAFVFFQNRGQDSSQSKSCADLAKTIASSATTDKDRFDALILQARCLYYFGTVQTTKDVKLAVFEEAKQAAEQAIKIYPQRTEGYYYSGINLARWSEANGITSSLSNAAPLMRKMEEAMNGTAVDDYGKAISGREFDGWGANRTLGRTKFKVPFGWGRDHDEALRLLEQAYKEMPKDRMNSLNVIFYAEVLISFRRKQEAKDILDYLISFEQKPETYNPDRIPETKNDIKEAKKIRKGLG